MYTYVCPKVACGVPASNALNLFADLHACLLAGWLADCLVTLIWASAAPVVFFIPCFLVFPCFSFLLTSTPCLLVSTPPLWVACNILQLSATNTMRVYRGGLWQSQSTAWMVLATPNYRSHVSSSCVPGPQCHLPAENGTGTAILPQLSPAMTVLKSNKFASIT